MDFSQQPQEQQNTVVDATALQIADMLDINLSGAATAEEGTQLVAQAIEDLVMKLHELTQNGGEQQPEQELDEDGNPIEGEQPEVDEDDNPIETEQGGETDEDGNPIEPEQGVEEQSEELPQSTLNQLKKKKMPIRASYDVSPRMLKLAKQNRDLQILKLAEDGHITPIVMKRLQKRYTNDEALGLALSSDDGDDDFEETIADYLANGQVLSFDERTGHQSAIELPKGTKLELSAEEIRDPKHNPLLADAEARKA